MIRDARLHLRECLGYATVSLRTATNPRGQVWGQRVLLLRDRSTASSR